MAISRWKEKLKEESGNVLVLAALSMTVLLAFIGLAADVGILFQTRRNVQTAADAAAVAGALDYLYNGSTDSAKGAGKAASSANGVTDGTNSAVVTINIPPSFGPNSGSSAYVEALVSRPTRTFFMGMKGQGLTGVSSVTVTARAVAGIPTNGQACIWLMANSGMALDLQGNYDIEATDCGVYVNSPSSNALKVTGNGGTMNTKFLDVVGNSTSVHATSPTAPTLNAAPRKSPWGNLTGPTESNGGCTTVDKTTTSVTGTVTGPGLNNAICYQKAVTLNGATLGAGTYMFEKGVTISGTVTVNGGTLDVYGGTFNQPSNTLVNITAPTSGTYNGIAIMQPSNNTNDLQVQFGSNNETLDGYIYSPGAEVYLQDNGGGIVATGIVAATMFDKASTIRIPSYDKAHPTTTKNRVVTLVE
jgi:Flp pilus assembly protein TadG